MYLVQRGNELSYFLFLYRNSVRIQKGGVIQLMSFFKKRKKAVLESIFLVLFLACAGMSFVLLKEGKRFLQVPFLKIMENVEMEVGDEVPDFTEYISANTFVKKLKINTNKVNTVVPGKYPVEYFFQDGTGKQYKKVGFCTVRPRKNIQVQKVQKKDNFADNIIPKTEDAFWIYGYTFMSMLSFVVIVRCLLDKNKEFRRI